MKMPNLGGIYSPGRGHMISKGEINSTNEKRSLELLSTLSYLQRHVVYQDLDLGKDRGILWNRVAMSVSEPTIHGRPLILPKRPSANY